MVCKAETKIATYRNTTTAAFNLEQIDTTHFSQIDYVLLSVHHSIMNSDHALLTESIKVTSDQKT
jgi:hypothetical protein